MSVMIGNARIDENGGVRGGAAGDQTGKEVMIQPWYSYPWDVVLRPKSPAAAEKMAACMETLCKSGLVGYDQSQRTSLWTAMAQVGFDPAKLKETCETDCSAMVAVCVRAAGIPISRDAYTGNLQAVCLATGQFEALTGSKYRSVPGYLRRGDILLNTSHHTAIVLTNGSLAETETEEVFETAKTYRNGSTPEPVYADTALTMKTGSLNPWETCRCLAVTEGRYLVEYQVDGRPGVYKTGFTAYGGGVRA